jgi:hypothetical protein
MTDKDQALSLQELSGGYNSKYDLDLSVLHDGKTLKSIKDLEVQHIIGFDQQLSSRTLISNTKIFDKKA